MSEATHGRPPEVIVRPVRPDDAAGVVAVLNPIIAAGVYTTFDTSIDAAAEREYIEGLPERAIFHVALAGTRLVGFQSLEPFADYTRAFDHVGVIGTYVDLGRRRQGIGRALFARTLAEAKRRGYAKLFTYIRADNPAALAAYRAQGFVSVGIARDHARIGDRVVDVYVVERPL